MTKKQISKRFKQVGIKFETKDPLFGICFELRYYSYLLEGELQNYIPINNYILPTRFSSFSAHTKEHNYIRAILCYLISEAVKSE